MLTRAASAVVAAALSVVSTVGPLAQAVPVPVYPSDPAVAQQWVNPAIRTNEAAAGLIAELQAAPSNIRAGEPLELTVRVRNTSGSPASGLQLTPRRAPVSGSVGDARYATVADIGEYSIAGPAVDVPDLAPGEQREVTFTVPTAEGGGGLEMGWPGSYPLVVALSQDGAVTDTDRWHMTVTAPADADAEATTVPAGMTMLLPLTARTDIVPGETGEAPNRPELILSSEQLAEEIAPGGRLDRLVDIYGDDTRGNAPAVRKGSCIAVDPELVDTVERMSEGYSVATSRPPAVKEQKRLRDSWGSDDDVDSAAGTGANHASAWLVKLRNVAAQRCVVALPWSNADLNAVSQSGNPWLMREALERGPFTVERILGTPVVRNVVIPPSGYVGAETARGLGWADHTNSQVPRRGMHAAWEADPANGSQNPSNAKVEGDGTTTLDRTEAPNAAGAAAPPPATTVRVLLAENTVPSTPGQDSRFAFVAPNVAAVTFHPSLTQALAATGPDPRTMGYSDATLRFDFAIDSVRARDITAAAAVRLAAAESAVQTVPGAQDGPDQPQPDPVLVTPPADWAASTAGEIIDTVADLMATGGATPISFDEYIRVPVEPADPVPPEQLGTPYDDPTVFSDAELLSVSQQAGYIDDLTRLMVNDPAIALSRYGFTLPLRTDLLRSLSATGRNSIASYSESVDATGTRLNGGRDTLTELRSAVALIPPGNVYTRASAASPLLIVAENGLPLPVSASIVYQGPDGAVLSTPPEIRIPARGSITINMTADLPADTESGHTDLQLYLAAPNKSPISQPVEISVRTVGWMPGTRVLLTVVGLVFLLAVAATLGRRRAKFRQSRQNWHKLSSDHPG